MQYFAVVLFFFSIVNQFVGTLISFGLGSVKSERINPLRPNDNLSETSHCNIKGVSVSEVMRIENKITPVKFF